MTRAARIIACAIVGASMFAGAASAQVPSDALIIVLPFDNLKHEPTSRGCVRGRRSC